MLKYNKLPENLPAQNTKNEIHHKKWSQNNKTNKINPRPRIPNGIVDLEKIRKEYFIAFLYCFEKNIEAPGQRRPCPNNFPIFLYDETYTPVFRKPKESRSSIGLQISVGSKKIKSFTVIYFFNRKFFVYFVFVFLLFWFLCNFYVILNNGLKFFNN